MDRALSEEVLYGRDPKSLRIFVSSRMKTNLDTERAIAAQAIESISGHRAWYWERDAPPGALHAERECISIARTSDGIVLLIAGDLSEVVLAEYKAARDRGADRYVLVRDRDSLPAEVKEFLDGEQRNNTVSQNFQNADELRTHILNALLYALTHAARTQIVARAQGRRS